MSSRPKPARAPGSQDPHTALGALVEKVGQVGRWHLSAADGRVHFSESCNKVLGRVPPKTGLSPEVFAACFAESDRPMLLDGLRGLRNGQDLDLHATLDRPGGGRCFARVKAFRERGTGQKSPDCFGLIQDLSEVQNAMLALAAAHERHADFAELVTEWMWETDEDFCYTSIPIAMEKALGLQLDQEDGRSRRRHLLGGDPSLEMEMHLAWLGQREPYESFQYTATGPDGQVLHLSSSAKPIYDADGVFLGYRGIEQDLTAAEEARQAVTQANRRLGAANREKSDAIASLQETINELEEKNRNLVEAQNQAREHSIHDPLTGVGTRQSLEDVLETCVHQCADGGQWLGVLHLGLDRFREINDIFGYSAGDAVLAHVAKVLEANVGEGDFVARVGGDEFVVVCTNDEGEQNFSGLAQTLIEVLAEPFDFEGNECWFGTSIGIATMHGAEIRTTDLLVNADMALDLAKAGGRGRYEFFSADMQRKLRERKVVADGIRAGLPRGEFIAYYQPQVCAQTWQIVGCEALARWRHPKDGIRPPDHFIEIAEDLGLTPSLDRAILDNAIFDLWSWEDQGVTVPKVSVNLSARRLLDDDLVSFLQTADLPRGRLAFELLESIFLDDVEDTIAWNIDTLKEMGFEIELDDFGSGHTSLLSLVKLGPNAIKIDRELVAPIAEDPTRRELLASIVGIGKSLGVSVTAEGVETRQQAEILAELGCVVLQGYFFARPMCADDFRDFVVSWTGKPQDESKARRKAS